MSIEPRPLQETRMRILTKSLLAGEEQREAVTDLLRWYFSTSQVSVGHLENGKPFLPDYPDYSISISHCNSDVAIAIAKGHDVAVGIDVENKRAQAQRLWQRISTPSELILSSSLGLHPLWFWCAKEAVFKTFSDRMKTPYTSVEVRGVERDGALSVSVLDDFTIRVVRRVLPSGAALAYCIYE